MFKFSGEVGDDNKWTFKVEVPGGNTVTKLQVAQVLTWACNHFISDPATRVLTVAEDAALAADYAERSRLPDGWSVTNDAIGIVLTDGVQSHARTYAKGGCVVTAPCDAQGLATSATRDALLAADASPAPLIAEA